MEKLIWSMLKKSHFQHEKKKHQSEDQDHSTIKHGSVVAQIFGAQAYGKLGALFRSFGDLSTTSNFWKGFNIILDSLILDSLKFTTTTWRPTRWIGPPSYFNQNCGFSIHCSLVINRKYVTYFWCRHLDGHHMSISWQLWHQSCPLYAVYVPCNIGDHDLLQA